jgi:hypothetical protein
MLRVVALERFCERTLGRVSELCGDSEHTFHDRYGEVYGFIQESDKQIAICFDDPRRSKADLQLAAMYVRDLVSEEELDEFTEETSRMARELVGRTIFSNDEGPSHD